MVMLVTAQIFVLSGIIATIGAITPEIKNCTEADKIYYGTYKFAVCDMEQYLNWCYKGRTMSKHRAQFFKDSDPDYRDSSNCTGYSTSCDYLRFLTNVCGANYKVCHTDQERKIIIKMWIKQFIRQTVYKVGEFEDDSLELKNGKCNDILKDFFDDKEINEISEMIGPADIKQLGITGYNFFSNVTVLPMGVLAKKDESGRMPIPERITNIIRKNDDYSNLTIPSHWKYCDWKLTHEFKRRTNFRELPSLLPDLWHCDGKCNTNKGDDQAWYETRLGIGGMYIDLNNGEFKTEDYMIDLVRNSSEESSSDKGVFGCYLDTNIDYDNDDCEKYQNFVKYCLDPIEKCLGNIAIREVVLYATVRDFKPYKCWEKASNSNYLMSTLILTILCILFNKVI